MAFRFIVLAAVLAGFLYLFARTTEQQIQNRIAAQVDRAQSEIEAIVEAAADHYRMDVTNSDGSDPWRTDFQFARVDELWPDLFSRVDHPETQPTDPFDPEQQAFLVATQGDTILAISLGPDERLEISPGQIEQAFDSGAYQDLITGSWSYSPTNGANSAGEIFAAGMYRK
jgi:hypothetical protein